MTPSSADPAEPRAAARDAGLRYATDASPGLSRRRAGRGFTYRDADGGTIRDAETLARIKALAIPPAWTDVWICRWPNGHLQATGRDARGRKQYRYHDRWHDGAEPTSSTGCSRSPARCRDPARDATRTWPGAGSRARRSSRPSCGCSS